MNQPQSTTFRQANNYYKATNVGWAQSAVKRIAHQGYAQTLSLSLSLCLLIGMMGMAGTLWGQTADTYPKPVSEYAEQTGPGQMTFLAYPKYYRNANNQLTEVNTTLAVSSDPDWDYEVITGIWSLHVRKDGTFQAQHAGDSFTYQFDSLGIDRGSGFQPLDLGKADFSQMVVAGDTVTWKNVVEGVDLKVRYIHDILKVDVVVKKETMSRIKTSVQRGELNPNTYLTARFNIPSVMITSQAKRGKDNADIYAERLDLGAQPLRFEKNSQTIHKLRPVETYLLDDTGKQIEFWNNDPKPGNEINIHCAQAWQLKPNQPGLAEMSARLDDLVNLPDGDVVIDPSIFFYYGNSIQDTWLSYQNQNTIYGSSSSFSLSRNGTNSDRALISFLVMYNLPEGINISNVNLNMKINSINVPNTSFGLRAHKVTSHWYESYANWIDATSVDDWSTGGGDFENLNYQGKKKVITASQQSGSWVQVDCTYAFKSHLIDHIANIFMRGFLLSIEDENGSISFRSKEYSVTGDRPYLTVEYAFTKFGADGGNGNDQGSPSPVDEHQNAMKEDNLNIIRFFDHGISGNDPDLDGSKLVNFVNKASSKGMKVILVFPAKAYSSVSTYATRVYDMLNLVNTKWGNTVIAVELSNEEEWFYDVLQQSFWAGSYHGGQLFAAYYLAAYDEIKQNLPNFHEEIICGGSVRWHAGLIWNYTTDFGCTKSFLEGFIDSVIIDGQYSIDKLPDTFALHSYTNDYLGCYSPEFWIKTDDANTMRSEYFYRLKELFDICNARGIIPNFADTEYGVSPSTVSGSELYTPGNSSEKAQAVYYIRRTLMNSTMCLSVNDNSIPGIGWRYSLYFHHPISDVNVGFMGEDQNGDPYSRAIRDVTRKIMDVDAGNTNPHLGDDNSQIWIPLVNIHETSDNYAYCGWFDSSGQKWGAIWRYKNQTDYYEPSSLGEDRDFIVEGGDFRNWSVNLYRFNITSGSASFNTQSSTVTSGYSPTEDSTTFTISGVTENPTFIKFN